MGSETGRRPCPQPARLGMLRSEDHHSSGRFRSICWVLSWADVTVLLIKGRGPPYTEPGVVLPGCPTQCDTNSSSCLFRELNVFSFTAIIFILKNSSLTFIEAFPFERSCVVQMGLQCQKARFASPLKALF